MVTKMQEFLFSNNFPAAMVSLEHQFSTIFTLAFCSFSVLAVAGIAFKFVAEFHD